MNSIDDRGEPQDSGLILIPTLILTFIVAVVVVAVLGYVATGLRTSTVTTERTDDANVAAAAVYWAMEVLATEDLEPGFCDASITIEAPAAAMPNDEVVPITCAPTAFDDTEGVERVLFSVSLTSSAVGDVTALVDYRPTDDVPRPVRIHSWNP